MTQDAKTRKLDISPRLARPDDLYAKLIDAHRDLQPAESSKLNSKLILLLANHIGDAEVIDEAIDLARKPFDR